MKRDKKLDSKLKAKNTKIKKQNSQNKENSLFSDLNENQIQALKNSKSHLLIQGGAQTGKTEILLRKYAQLISEGIEPDEILVLSYSKEAAVEFLNRAKLLTNDNLNLNWIGTIHQISGRFLRQNIGRLHDGKYCDYEIINQDQENAYLAKFFKENEKLLKEFVQNFTKYQNQAKMYLIIIQKLQQFKKNRLSYGDKLDSNLYTELEQQIFQKIYKGFDNFLLENSVVKVDDLIFLMYKIMKECPSTIREIQNQFQYILVDDVQDLDQLQQEWLKLISSGKKQKLICTGDLDQQIFKFRDANNNFILNFTSIFKKSEIIRLNQNYRSLPFILDSAKKLISFNQDNTSQNMFVDREDSNPGRKVNPVTRETWSDEVQMIANHINSTTSKRFDLNQIAILTRLKRHGEEIGRALYRLGIPYQTYQRKVTEINGESQKFEVRALLQYLQLLYSSDIDKNTESVLLTLDNVDRGTIESIYKMKNKISKLKEWQKKDISLIEFCCLLSENHKESQLKNLNEAQPQSGSKSQKKIKVTTQKQKNDKTFDLIIDQFRKEQGAESILQLVKAYETFQQNLETQSHQTINEKLKTFLENSNFFKYLMKQCIKQGLSYKQVQTNVKVKTQKILMKKLLNTLKALKGKKFKSKQSRY
eukprot:403335985